MFQSYVEPKNGLSYNVNGIMHKGFFGSTIRFLGSNFSKTIENEAVK
jgi:hypothetical protein